MSLFRKRRKMKQRLQSEAYEADRRRERETRLRDSDTTADLLVNPTSVLYYEALGGGAFDQPDVSTGNSDCYDGSGSSDSGGGYDSGSSDSGGYDSGGSDCGGDYGG